jgi:hypothetical protein
MIPCRGDMSVVFSQTTLVSRIREYRDIMACLASLMKQARMTPRWGKLHDQYMSVFYCESFLCDELFDAYGVRV